MLAEAEQKRTATVKAAATVPLMRVATVGALTMGRKRAIATAAARPTRDLAQIR